jgi:hypothetical protein
MARKKVKADSEFVLFDVLYADGTRRSNRRVPSSALDGLDGDAPAMALIEAQDQELGDLSGRPRPRIASILRSPTH